MKKLFFAFIIATLFFQSSFAQTQSLFIENFSSTISGTQFTNWTRGRTDGTPVPTSNNAPFTPVNNTPSTGYSGASGGIAMIIANGAVSGTNEYVFSTTGYSSIGYSSLNVNYGFRRTATFSSDGTSTGAANFPVLEWSSDANTWNIVSGTNALSTVTSTWNLATASGFDLPSSALNQSTLYFRFRVTTNSTGTGNLRIDDFSVTGIAALSSAASITGFTLAGIAASINGSMINVTVPNGTILTSVVASGTISANATVNPSFASITDFSSAVTFTVTAENMSTTGVYTVNATVAALLSDANSITGFSIPSQAGTTTISGTTIGVSMPYGTNLTALTPTITLSPLAIVDPVSGVAQDFSSGSITYTVTAQSGAIRSYSVTVSALPGSGANSITGFTLPGQSGATTISGNTILINVFNGTNVTAISPATLTISPLSAISPSTTTSLNFSSMQTYTVTSQLGTTNIYNVTVTILPLVTIAGITENFTYGSTPSALISAAPTKWFAHSGGGTNSVQYTTSNLTMTNYSAGQGLGGAISFGSGTGTREDINTPLQASGYSSGTAYASILYSISSVTGTGDYNFHLLNATAGTSTGAFFGRVAVKPSSISGVDFGIAKSGTIVWGIDDQIPYGTTVLLVNRYTFISGTANDLSDLFVITGSVPVTEPSVPSASGVTSEGDITNIAGIAIRQGSTGFSSIIADGLKTGTSWSSIYTLSVDSPDNFITGFTLPVQPGIMEATQAQISGNMITITVPFGSNLASPLSTTGIISNNATVNPSFSLAQNFSAPVLYTVTAQNLSTNVYTITAFIQPTPSDNNTISGFSFPIQPGIYAGVTATVDNIAKTVNINFPASSNITNLKPIIVTSPLATVNPSFNVFRDFSSMLTYTVTAQSGVTSVYSVTSTIAPPSFNRIATLGELRNSLDANGITTVVGIVTVTGQVYGVNIHTDVRSNPNTTSFQYSLIDGTGAISIRTNSLTFPLGTTVGISSGDMITVVGIFEGTPGATGPSGGTAYGQFNGWLQLTPVAPVIKGTSNNPPKVPAFVTSLGENLESDVVSIVADIETSGTYKWADDPSPFPSGFSVLVTFSGTNKATVLRIIPQGSELYGKTFAQVFGSTSNTKNITITGIVGQFHTNYVQTGPLPVPAGPPYNGGYQITPNKLNDIIYPGKFDPQTITGFTIPGQVGETTFSGNNISILMPPGTSVTALIPAFTVTGGASVNPSAGSPVDFSSLVTYTVTAFGGAKSFYTVTVTSPYVPSAANEVLSLIYLPQTANGLNTTVTGTISGASIYVDFPSGVILGGLVPTITRSPLSTASLPDGVFPSTLTGTDEYPVKYVYTVTAEDGVSQPYNIFLKVLTDTITGISGSLTSKSFEIYPNPATASFTVTTSDAGIEIFNALGVKVFETPAGTSETSISTSTFNKGIYLVKVKGSPATKVLIIE